MTKRKLKRLLRAGEIAVMRADLPRQNGHGSCGGKLYVRGVAGMKEALWRVAALVVSREYLGMDA